MTQRASILLLALIAFAQAPTCAGAAEASDPPTQPAAALRVGDMAPDFALDTLDGKRVALSQCLGRDPVVLVFWSYFCFPCQKEMPELAAFYREGQSSGVQIIGLSLDGPAYDAKVRPFLAENAITFPNAYDRETEDFFEVAERYGVVGTPTTFVVDPQGRVRLIHLGRIDRDVLGGVLRAAREPSFCPEILKPPREP